MLPMVVASRHKSRAEETNQSIKQLENMKSENLQFLLETIKKQKEEIEQLKKQIEEIKDTAIYYSKNNIKIH